MLTLYVEGYFTNVWDASCLIALAEKQLEFTTARALLRDGQGVPAALRDDAAIGRIPALQHGDIWLTESLAIVEYLDDVFPQLPVLPTDRRARARARQVMSWLRSDMLALRAERPWQLNVYPPAGFKPMSDEAAKEAEELVQLIAWLDAHGEFATWNLAQSDLALAAMRLTGSGYPVPPAVQQLVDRNLARPSVRSYVYHSRPPNPPPAPRS